MTVTLNVYTSCAAYASCCTSAKLKLLPLGELLCTSVYSELPKISMPKLGWDQSQMGHLRLTLLRKLLENVRRLCGESVIMAAFVSNHHRLS